MKIQTFEISDFQNSKNPNFEFSWKAWISKTMLERCARSFWALCTNLHLKRTVSDQFRDKKICCVCFCFFGVNLVFLVLEPQNLDFSFFAKSWILKTMLERSAASFWAVCTSFHLRRTVPDPFRDQKLFWSEIFLFLLVNSCLCTSVQATHMT